MTDDMPIHVLHRRDADDLVVVTYDDDVVATVYGYPDEGAPLVEVELHVQRRCDLGDVFLVDDCGCRARLDRALGQLDRPDRVAPGVLVYVEHDDLSIYEGVAAVLRRLGVERVRLLDHAVAEAVILRGHRFTVLHGLNEPVTPIASVTSPSSTSSDVDDHPIVAYLPRDWPRQLDRLLVDLDVSPGSHDAVRALACRVVDGWVLAAATS